MHPSQVKEVPIRKVIVTVQEYLWAGLRGWPWLLLGALLVGGYQAWEAYQRPIFYSANTTFVVNEDQGSGGGGLGSVLGQIGLGGGGGGGGHNLKRIMAFATSKYLLNDLLLDTVTLKGTPDLLINHVITYGELAEKLELKLAFGIDQLSVNQVDSLSRQEGALLKAVYTYLTEDDEFPIVTDIADDTGMLTITAKTRDEDLTLELSTGLYQYISEFYRKETTGQSQATVTRLQSKADSILKELNAAEYQLASFTDTRLSLNNRRDQLKTVQLSRKIQILGLAYGEIVRNLETAKFTLSAKTPFFQLVDEPFKPLFKMKANPLKNGIKGGLLGGVLGFVFVGMMRFYQEAMSEE
ncbi:MAG: hypothetical protein AB8H12_22355 [Lewinella sp.]